MVFLVLSVPAYSKRCSTRVRLPLLCLGWAGWQWSPVSGKNGETEAYLALYTHLSSRQSLGVCLLRTLEFPITVGVDAVRGGWPYSQEDETL